MANDNSISLIALLCGLLALVIALAGLIQVSYNDLADLPELFDVDDIPNIDLQHGLCLWLPLDGSFLDCSGYYGDYLNSGCVFVSGVYDDSVDFGSGNNYFVVSDSDVLGIDDSLFIFCWLYVPLSYDGSVQRIIYQRDGFKVTLDDYLYFAVTDSALEVSVHSNSYLSKSCWYYFYGVASGGSVYMVLNGTLQSDVDVFSGSFDNGVFDIYFGCHVNSGSVPDAGYYVGLIDEVRIYNRVLSNYEINALCTLNA